MLPYIKINLFNGVFYIKVLDDVELKTLAPALPSNTILSVLMYPVSRQAPPINESKHFFTFVSTEERVQGSISGEKSDVLEKSVEKKVVFL